MRLFFGLILFALPGLVAAQAMVIDSFSKAPVDPYSFETVEALQQYVIDKIEIPTDYYQPTESWSEDYLLNFWISKEGQIDSMAFVFATGKQGLKSNIEKLLRKIPKWEPYYVLGEYSHVSVSINVTIARKPSDNHNLPDITTPKKE